MELTQEYIKNILDYNPDTGLFKWKKRDNTNSVRSGTFNTRFYNKIAGSIDIVESAFHHVGIAPCKPVVISIVAF